MPLGKPAGVRCVQLDAQGRCLIFGQPERPAVCASLRPSVEMCGTSAEAALAYLRNLEEMSQPERERACAPGSHGLRMNSDTNYPGQE